MLKYIKLSILILLANSTIYSQSNSKTNKKNSTEVQNTSENFNGFNRELLIKIKEDSISAYALIAKDKSEKETVILISGYPGNDNNFDIGQEIRRRGKNVILFNHRGAWGSQGIYSYSNCLEDIQEIIHYLSQEETSKKLRINKEKFTLIGRSFGGGIALIQGSQIPTVKKIIAISSVNYGDLMMKYESINELEHFKTYMRKQIMINHNIDDFLQELLDKKEEFNIIKYSSKLKSKNVLLIEDSNKNEHWISQLENSEYVIVESDHNFVEERKELESIIINWLKNH